MKNDILPPYPEGHRFYGEFEPLTLTDGWCYGYITASPCHLHPDGCESGDGFAVAPDGTYAGLVWWTECPFEFEDITDPDSDSYSPHFWGVFEMRFPKKVVQVEDLTFNFRHILPKLKQIHQKRFAGNQTETETQ